MIRQCPYCQLALTSEDIVCPRCGMTFPNFDFNQAPTRAKSSKVIWQGIAAAQIAALLMYLFDTWLMSFDPSSRGYAGAVFTLIPFGMGTVSAFIWRSQDLTIVQYLGYSCATCLISIILSAIALREGVICLLMASPLLILAVWAGSLFGRWMFMRKDNRLNASFVPLLLILMVADARTPHNYQGSVVDKITIHATPQQVWKYIPDYPLLTAKPDYWLFSIGLPRPVLATTSGHYVGADRKCIFSGDKVFDEKIVECDPGKRLTFDVVEQPKDPEIVGHLRLDRGQFILQDNGDGTTTVTGTSWYHLYVYPTTYFNWWTEDIIRHVHLRVMGYIKTLAERDR